MPRIDSVIDADWLGFRGLVVEVVLMKRSMIKTMLLLPAILMLQGCLWSDDGIDACVADLTANLKAPSTLKLVSVYRGEMPPIDEKALWDKLSRVIARDEARFDELNDSDRLILAYLKERLATKRITEIERDLLDTPSYSLLLSYDAENSFGAPIRGHYWCRIFDPKERGDSSWEAGSVSDEQAITDKSMMKEVSLPLF